MSADPPPSASEQPQNATVTEATSERRESISQRSEDSQTAADFIRDQMQLEADAREALPYSIENCTKPLGSLRQNVFACLTCNPPPSDPTADFTPAGVCYSCSVQCHGEHELVEIFQKRNFTCDCGTTQFTAEQPCTLRIHPETNTKGGVHSEPADPNNKYNQNFRNRFCSCAIDYNPHEQKGTMFQCLGLGNHENGGCGEDWYHPGCLMGLGPKWYEASKPANKSRDNGNASLPTIAEDGSLQDDTPQQGDVHNEVEEEDDAPLPEGFPAEDDFEHFVCYKCVDANPWIKKYAGTSRFLAPLYLKTNDVPCSPKKRQRDEDDDDVDASSQAKRVKSEQPLEAPETTSSTLDNTTLTEVKEESKGTSPSASVACKLDTLPPTPSGQFSLFVKEGFRDQLCRCADCFSKLQPHPQLLEEEEAYEPPLTDAASDNGSTHGSGSLYERGESALRNVDRVRAIEGVMAYNHMKEKLKPFFEQFAGSGQAISAEDVKNYFAKLRGDQEGIKEAGESAKADQRKEQSGY
ncbi:putative Zinc finger in N-recognin-domain-containing protein [Seiridium cardinale]